MENTIQLASVKAQANPPYVGKYCIGGYGGGYGGVCISFTKKPNFFHRTMMKVCLGWEWTDITKN
jgi:hypothetical protein